MNWQAVEPRAGFCGCPAEPVPRMDLHIRWTSGEHLTFLTKSTASAGFLNGVKNSISKLPMKSYFN